MFFIGQNLKHFHITYSFFELLIFFDFNSRYVVLEVSEAVVQRSSRSEVFCTKGALKILQNSQENHCARVSFFNKVAGLRSATLLKKRLWQKCFPLNFAKFLGTPFLQNTSWRLLLVVYRTQYNSLKCTRSSCENCSYNSKNVLFNSN